jgi:hypothetical protein
VRRPALAARIEGSTACIVCSVPIRLTDILGRHGFDTIGDGDAGEL